MLNDPMSAIGRVESVVSNLERAIGGKADGYEVSSISSDVGSLQHTVQELSSAITGLRDELQTLTQQDRIVERLEALEELLQA